MDRAVMPEPRLKPLPVETDPGLKDAFQTYVKVLGMDRQTRQRAVRMMAAPAMKRKQNLT